MIQPVGRGLFGRQPRRRRLAAWFVVALAVAIGTFAAYAVGVFHISGGVIFIPGDAALLGLVAAGVAGYTRSGLVAGWLVAAGALLGYRADHAFLGLSGRTRGEQLGYFLEFEGLGVIAIQAVVVALLGFVVGLLVRLLGAAVNRRLAGSAGGS